MKRFRRSGWLAAVALVVFLAWWQAAAHRPATLLVANGTAGRLHGLTVRCGDETFAVPSLDPTHTHRLAVPHLERVRLTGTRADGSSVEFEHRRWGRAAGAPALIVTPDACLYDDPGATTWATWLTNQFRAVAVALPLL